VAGQGSLPVGPGLEYRFELDYLFGKDRVANTDFAGGMLDMNDGDLRGFNVYADVTQKLSVGRPLDVGLLFGLGSGDGDKTGGAGNLNRIQTMGFFAYTNVWEDSIMPDVEGISPQGLGSPASRGYRELENTIAVQGRVGAAPWKPVRLDASYTLLRATKPVHGWNAMGPTTATARSLGQELDANATVTLYPSLKVAVLFGWFMTGDAAALLVNGDTAVKEDAWEIKQTLTYIF